MPQTIVHMFDGGYTQDPQYKTMDDGADHVLCGLTDGDAQGSGTGFVISSVDDPDTYASLRAIGWRFCEVCRSVLLSHDAIPRRSG
jgi:hypothetical protein